MKHQLVRLFASSALLACGIARADVFVPVASFESSEADLSFARGGADPTLALTVVNGGAGGAPAATDGARVLRLAYTNESDRKIEFRLDWSSTTYDLAGADELLMDVYVATSGAAPNLMGVWSPNWQPPDAWQPSSNLPAQVGAWTTVRFNVSQREQVGLNFISAIVFEDLAGSSGTIYVDNLRLRGPGGPQTPQALAANGHAGFNVLAWRPVRVQGLNGYHVYRAAAVGGPFERITATPSAGEEYRDDIGVGAARQYYRVSSMVDGVESPLSDIVSAEYDGLSDEQLLDLVQSQTFQYFWNGAHPNCGMAREGIGLGHPSDTVTIGGTGFGLMALCVGAERGFVTRSAAALRVLKIVRFLDGVRPDNPSLPSNVQRYHGAWAHHYNGVTGATIPFAGAADNGGDLVETAFLVEGLLAARQYFDAPSDAVEVEIRSRATSMWETVEWSWYRRFPGGNVLYWHWSPTHAWQMNLPIRGWNETQIVYLLAIASPTYPMPAASYAQGFAGNADFVNGHVYYGYRQWLGEPYGGPLFFTHYSNLGFDPRYKRDGYCNYFANARNTSLINRAYCIENPNSHAGYSPYSWGLTASNNPWGYLAHSPTNDNGTIAPTAALSAMPYVPAESLAALRHWVDNRGSSLFGVYGPYDAFNDGAGWTAPGWLAIDQGPIVAMIENYRSELCWNLFMANPEIAPMMQAIGLHYDVDFDLDGDIDALDFEALAPGLAGPGVTTPPGGYPAAHFELADLDDDLDVDLHDLSVFQRLFTGP